jgi:hypothetical protein
VGSHRGGVTCRTREAVTETSEDVWAVLADAGRPRRVPPACSAAETHGCAFPSVLLLWLLLAALELFDDGGIWHRGRKRVGVMA